MGRPWFSCCRLRPPGSSRAARVTAPRRPPPRFPANRRQLHRPRPRLPEPDPPPGSPLDGTFTNSEGRTARFRLHFDESWDLKEPRGVLIFGARPRDGHHREAGGLHPCRFGAHRLGARTGPHRGPGGLAAIHPARASCRVVRPGVRRGRPGAPGSTGTCGSSMNFCRAGSAPRSRSTTTGSYSWARPRGPVSSPGSSSGTRGSTGAAFTPGAAVCGIRTPGARPARLPSGAHPFRGTRLPRPS